MCRPRYFLLSLLALLLLVGSATLAKDPTTPVSGGITVGEFALRVIRLTEDDPTVRASITAEQAVERLKLAGLRFRGAPGDPLTEGEKSAFFFAVANGLMEKVTPPPSGFETCAGLATVPECHTCCIALAGSNNRSCGGACGRAHANLNVSPSEPLP